MANRAYLYTANEDFSKLRDVSESRQPIPFIYKLVCSVNTEICKSKIWNYEHPIAIKGEFEGGLQKFYDFFDYLKSQRKLNHDAVSKAVEDTRDFFNEHSDRVGKWFFLEGGEVFDLIADIDPIEVQNKDLHGDIQRMNADIEDLLQNKPTDMFEHLSGRYWVSQLLDEQALELEAYWTHVTYFSFNNSDS